jgi:hypothetical protein
MFIDLPCGERIRLANGVILTVLDVEGSQTKALTTFPKSASRPAGRSAVATRTPTGHTSELLAQTETLPGRTGNRFRPHWIGPRSR